MNRFVAWTIGAIFAVGLVTWVTRPLGAQAPTGGRLVVFADMALFSGPKQPRNCWTMNRYKPGEPVGFRITVVDGATGQPATDATVVVHLAYAGKTIDVPARYRGVAGRGPVIPNLWTAKWEVPADFPTGTVGVTVTARDKIGRTAEWKPFPQQDSHLTIVTE